MKSFLLPLLALGVMFSPPLFAQSRGVGLANNATSPIVFNGLIMQGGVTKVSLHNPNTGDTKWVQVGKKFGSYTVGFQPGVPGQTADAVILTIGASSQRILLQEAVHLSSTTTLASSNTAQPVQNPARATLIERQRADLNSLDDQLAKMRSDPNADPRQIEAMEAMRAGIQQQQNQLASGDAAVIKAVMSSLALTNDATSATVKSDGTPSKDAKGKVKQVSAQPAANAANPTPAVAK